MRIIEEKQLNTLNCKVHCTNEISFIPGSVNSIAYNTFKFDTLKIGNEIVNANELFTWLKEHYENN